MLNLTYANTDILTLTTGVNAAIHVTASWTDLVISSGAVTPDTTPTIISTATTTTIVGTPASGTVRNVKTLHIRNTDVVPCVVTVNFNRNSGTTVTQLHAVTLDPGDCLEYIEGVGLFQVTSSFLPTNLGNANTSAVTATSADTYLTGSSIALLGLLQTGMILRWRFTMTKTGAGVATPIWTMRLGTAGTTADTSLGTFTTLAQTAATDTGWAEAELIIQNATSSGSGQGILKFDHNNTTTGLANAAQTQIKQIAPTSINWTTAGLMVGMSCNPGASGVWTFQTVSVSVHNVN